MRHLVILGAGTAGTVMVNRLRRSLDPSQWRITIVDKSPDHHYQPGFLFVPFGQSRPEELVRRKADFFPAGVQAVFEEVSRIDPGTDSLQLASGKTLEYDYLIVATGCAIHPEETEGLAGSLWRKQVFDFYTLDGAVALRDALAVWPGGRLVVNVTEMPIKCPVAPLEFAFLADAFFHKKGIRDRVEIHYVTPLPGAFTKPKCSEALGDLLRAKKIHLTTEFAIGRVDVEGRKIVSHDEQEIPFDLLVTVPTNKGSRVIADSGLGDELDFVPTDPGTLRSRKHANVFVLGDATDVPTSKAGSVAHFQADVLEANLLDVIGGREPSARFDGHANCFIETGFGKAVLVDFNYEIQPLPGRFPIPVVGPFSLLGESRINHWGKLAFEWIYWNLLITGAHLPISSPMKMSGKRRDPT